MKLTERALFYVLLDCRNFDGSNFGGPRDELISEYSEEANKLLFNNTNTSPIESIVEEDIGVRWKKYCYKLFDQVQKTKRCEFPSFDLDSYIVGLFGRHSQIRYYEFPVNLKTLKSEFLKAKIETLNLANIDKGIIKLFIEDKEKRLTYSGNDECTMDSLFYANKNSTVEQRIKEFLKLFKFRFELDNVVTQSKGNNVDNVVTQSKGNKVDKSKLIKALKNLTIE